MTAYLRLGFAFVFLAALACSDGFPPEFPAPDFTLKSPLTNTTESLATINGHPTIMYWFASW